MSTPAWQVLRVFRAWQRLHVFPRLATVAYFPALSISFIFFALNSDCLLLLRIVIVFTIYIKMYNYIFLISIPNIGQVLVNSLTKPTFIRQKRKTNLPEYPRFSSIQTVYK